MIPREPDSIAVCPLRRMPETVELLGATHLVSILNAHLMPATPDAIAPERHLRIAIDDIAAKQAGTQHPSAAHLARLIEFVRNWDRRAPLLIHCFAGLARSPAAAYIALCALNPDTPELLIAHRLRQASENGRAQSLDGRRRRPDAGTPRAARGCPRYDRTGLTRRRGQAVRAGRRLGPLGARGGARKALVPRAFCDRLSKTVF